MIQYTTYEVICLGTNANTQLNHVISTRLSINHKVLPLYRTNRRNDSNFLRHFANYRSDVNVNLKTSRVNLISNDLRVITLYVNRRLIVLVFRRRNANAHRVLRRAIVIHANYSKRFTRVRHMTQDINHGNRFRRLRFTHLRICGPTVNAIQRIVVIRLLHVDHVRDRFVILVLHQYRRIRVRAKFFKVNRVATSRRFRHMIANFNDLCKGRRPHVLRHARCLHDKACLRATVLHRLFTMIRVAKRNA